MQLDPERVAMGAAVYTPLMLRFYDVLVLACYLPFVWRCPNREVLALYARNVSACHLDVGVGTGYFLDRTPFPAAHPAVTLLDVNAACLAAASRRVARYEPRVVQANVLDPLPAIGPFSSVGLCALLHCVPGSIPAKALIFDHLKSVMAPAGRIFGATLVQGSVPRSFVAQRLMDYYNARGVFANEHDTVEDLESELAARFCKVNIRVRGSVALFEAQYA
jgi:SAM-dependent methyltransferase